MSVMVYRNNNGSDGFCGARATVMVGGEIRQKYFTFRDKDRPSGFISFQEQEQLIKEAHALDKEWKMAQQARRIQRQQQAVPTKRASDSTTVRGIRLKYDTEGHVRPVFEVGVTDDEGRQYPESFAIDQLGYEQAWREAVDFLCDVKSILEPEELYERMPEIPEELSALLNEQKKSDKKSAASMGM